MLFIPYSLILMSVFSATACTRFMSICIYSIDSGSLVQKDFTENLSWNILRNTEKKPVLDFLFLKKTPIQFLFCKFCKSFHSSLSKERLWITASINCGQVYFWPCNIAIWSSHNLLQLLQISGHGVIFIVLFKGLDLEEVDVLYENDSQVFVLKPIEIVTMVYKTEYIYIYIYIYTYIHYVYIFKSTYI